MADTITFKCPNCNAPLEYTGGEFVIKCDFCGMSAAVPAELRPSQKPDWVQATQDLEPDWFSMEKLKKLSEIEELTRQRQLIPAIKLYREITGADLVDAKNAIEALAAGKPLIVTRSATSPVYNTVTGERFSALSDVKYKVPATPASAKGAGGCILFLVVVTIAIPAVVLSTVSGMLNGIFSQFRGTIPVLPGNTNNPISAALRDPLGSLRPNDHGQLDTMGDQTYPDVVSLAYDTKSDSKYQLFYLDPNKDAVRWKVPASSDSIVLASADGVYATNKSKLSLLDSASGHVVWETNMTDQITISCKDCIATFANQVVVLSNDSMLQGFDKKSGARLWTKTLDQVSPRFMVYGDKLVVIDRNDKTATAQVTVLNQDGKPVRSFLVVCNLPQTKDHSAFQEHAYPYDNFTLDSASGALYAWYGGSNSCIQRYDINALNAKGAAWSTFSTIAAPTHGDTNFMIMGDLLISGGNEGIIAINTKTGAAQVLLEQDEDYQGMLPLATRDGVTLVRVERTRGTRRHELWAVDNDNSQVLWKMPLNPGGPIDPPSRYIGILNSDSEDEAWTWHWTNDGITLIRAVGKPSASLSIETLNPRTGTSSGRTSLPLPKITSLWSAPTVYGWKGDIAWMHIDGAIYALDVKQKKMTWASE